MALYVCVYCMYVYLYLFIYIYTQKCCYRDLYYELLSDGNCTAECMWTVLSPPIVDWSWNANHTNWFNGDYENPYGKLLTNSKIIVPLEPRWDQLNEAPHHEFPKHMLEDNHGKEFGRNVGVHFETKPQAIIDSLLIVQATCHISLPWGSRTMGIPWAKWWALNGVIYT